MENRETLEIKYYAISESDENAGGNLLSMNDRFNIIGKPQFLTIEGAMSELGPDTISEKNWDELIQCRPR